MLYPSVLSQRVLVQQKLPEPKFEPCSSIPFSLTLPVRLAPYLRTVITITQINVIVTGVDATRRNTAIFMHNLFISKNPAVTDALKDSGVLAVTATKELSKR